MDFESSEIDPAVEEFKTNVLLLIQCRYPEGLPLVFLEEEYNLYYQQDVKPSMIQMGDCLTWEQIFTQPSFQRDFVTFEIGQNMYIKSNRKMSHEEMSLIAKLAKQSHFDAAMKPEFHLPGCICCQPLIIDPNYIMVECEVELDESPIPTNLQDVLKTLSPDKSRFQVDVTAVVDPMGQVQYIPCLPTSEVNIPPATEKEDESASFTFQDKPNKKHKKKPKKESDKKPNKEPNKKPNNELNKKPNNELNKEPNKKPNNELNKEPNKKPNNELNKEPNKKPNNEPNKKPNNELNKEPNKKPNNEPNKKPIKKPNKPQSFNCSTQGCTKEFPSKALRAQHGLICEMKEFQCKLPNCERRFTNLKARRDHVYRHRKMLRTAIPCPVPDCSQVFTRVGDRNLHTESCWLRYATFG